MTCKNATSYLKKKCTRVGRMFWLEIKPCFDYDLNDVRMVHNNKLMDNAFLSSILN